MTHPDDRLLEEARRKLAMPGGKSEADLVQDLQLDIAALRPAFVEELNAQRAAMERAVTGNPVDVDALYRSSHSLKGLGGSFGFPEVTRICASLCQLLHTAFFGKAPLDPVDAELAVLHVQTLRTLDQPGLANVMAGLEAAVRHRRPQP